MWTAPGNCIPVWPRCRFDSDYKFMATFHNMTDEQGQAVVRCFVKGAPDVLMSAAARTGPRRPGPSWRRGERPVGATGERAHGKAGERVMVVARRDFDPQTFDPKDT